MLFNVWTGYILMQSDDAGRKNSLRHNVNARLYANVIAIIIYIIEKREIPQPCKIAMPGEKK